VPKISVITLFHNRWDLGRRFLDQWRGARLDPGEVELVLGDSGSTDGSAEIASQAADMADVTLFSGNLGFARGNNLLAGRASGELLVFLNYDVCLVPGCLEGLAAVFCDRPNLGVAGNVQLSVRARVTDHAGIYFDPSGHPYHARPPAASLMGLEFLAVPAVTGACMAVRRSLFEKLGGFDEGFRNSYEDIDLCMRARASGKEVGLAAGSTIWHHVSSSPGRFDAEEANAIRFADRWTAEAIALSRILPPVLDGPGIHPVLAAEDTLQVYIPSDSGYSEENSASTIYARGRWVDVDVPLSAGIDTAIHGLRLDPTRNPGSFRISKLCLRREGEAVPYWESGGAGLAAACRPSGTCGLRPGGSGLEFDSLGDDPQVLIQLPKGCRREAGRLWLTATIWNDCPETSR
jgi:GT2 family glycosyltransferase